MCMYFFFKHTLIFIITMQFFFFKNIYRLLITRRHELGGPLFGTKDLFIGYHDEGHYT